MSDNQAPELKIRISAVVDGAFHVGGGKGAGTNTAYVLRDARQRAYLPGSALKGKLRHYAMLLQEMRGGIQHDEANSETCQCDVCALFGSPGNARGKLSVGSLVSGRVAYTATEQRAGNQVDHMRRTVEDNKLFAIEAVNASECGVLVGEITGNSLTKEQERLLLESIKQVQWVGGNTSRGLGRVMLTPDVQYVDKHVPCLTPQNSHTRVHVKLTPEAPLFIGKQTRQSNFRDTLDYIPGEVVRAGLAAVITAECGSGKHGMRKWVTAPESADDLLYASVRRAFGDIRFSAFRPFGAMPYPFTARKGKYCEHVMDTLAYKLNGDIHEVKCGKGHCVDERTDDVRGWRSCKTSQYMALSTRSSINSRLGIVKDEALFSQQVIVPHDSDGESLSFSGWIEGDFDEAELRQLLGSPLLRVGALQSIGYGKMKAKIIPCDEDNAGKLRQRIESFNRLIKKPDGVYIPLLLLGNAVIEPPKAGGDARSLLNKLFPQYEWHKAYVRAQRWRGVNTHSKAGYGQFNDPKLLLEAGSVFVLQADGITDELLAGLLELERSFPYGMELYAADEFHTKEAYDG